MASTQTIEILSRGVLIHGEHILLCRSIEGDYYYLPGGHVDPGEPCARACEREIDEEAGLTVSAGQCLLVNELRFTQNGTPKHELTALFHVEHAGDGPADPLTPPPLEQREAHIELVWVPLAAIPDLDLRPRCIRAWLAAGGVVRSDVIGTDTVGTSRTEWLSVDEC